MADAGQMMVATSGTPADESPPVNQPLRAAGYGCQFLAIRPGESEADGKEAIGKLVKEQGFFQQKRPSGESPARQLS